MCALCMQKIIDYCDPQLIAIIVPVITKREFFFSSRDVIRVFDIGQIKTVFLTSVKLRPSQKKNSRLVMTGTIIRIS